MSDYRASIDIGSNSVLLLVASFAGNEISVVENHSHVTGLGRLLDKNGKFLDESMDETLAALSEYVEICKKYSILPNEIIATATEASRVSSNARIFYERIKTELNVNVQIISGEAEAYYSTKGILFDKTIEEDFPVILDIGGASSELIKVNRSTHEIENSFSMPMGSVRFTNWGEEGVREEKVLAIKTRFLNDLEILKTKYLHCVAGTMTSIGNMVLEHKEFVESDVHGLELTVEQILALRMKTAKFTAEKYLEHFPFLGKRSTSISGGLDLALTVFDWLGVEKVRISTYGLRYGTILEGGIKDEFVVRGNK